MDKWMEREIEGVERGRERIDGSKRHAKFSDPSSAVIQKEIHVHIHMHNLASFT
jgi:hypothetical protein